MRIRPRLTRVVLGTVLLPLVLGVLVLWSFGERADRTDKVPVAVVNLDRPVTQGSGKDAQVIAAGRLLAAGLTSPSSADDAGAGNLGWELTDAADARSGLADGSYYAVITIPKDFSTSLASASGDHPRRAQLSVRTNDASSALVGQASRQVAEVAAARLGRQVTRTYLDGVLSGTGDLKLQLGQASDAAGRVADGATGLADGARRLDGGAAELASGLGSLSAGAGELGGGAARLATGARTLADGADQLRAGAHRLDAGATSLVTGLDRLDRSAAPLPGQADRLADGAARVAEGTDGYARLLTAWKDTCLGNPVVGGAAADLCALTVQAVGADGGQADHLRSGARQVADGSRRLADSAPALTSAIGDAAGGARQLAAGAGRLSDGASRTSSGAGRLADGLADLQGGADRLAGGADQARAGAGRLADGSARLSEGSTRLSDGSKRLAGGLAGGADKIPDAPDSAAAVLADPVATAASSLNPQQGGRTLLAPAVLALSLWLGAFVVYLVRRALPAAPWSAARPAWRLALAGWLPGVLVGAVQAVLLLAGTLALGVRYGSPVGLGLILLVSAAAFTAVNQAFVAVLGPRRGWIAAIVFTALQAVSLGGLVPVDTAPGPLRLLHTVLPLPRAAEGYAHLTLGGAAGSPWADATVVLLWGVAGLLATTAAARRRQQVSLDDVRRQVAREPVGARTL